MTRPRVSSNLHFGVKIFERNLKDLAYELIK